MQRTVFPKTFCPSNACIVTKRNKRVHTLLYRMKGHSPCFLIKRMIIGATLSTWNFGPHWPCWNEDATPISNQYSLAAPQP